MNNCNSLGYFSNMSRKHSVLQGHENTVKQHTSSWFQTSTEFWK